MVSASTQAPSIQAAPPAQTAAPTVVVGGSAASHTVPPPASGRSPRSGNHSRYYQGSGAGGYQQGAGPLPGAKFSGGHDAGAGAHGRQSHGNRQQHGPHSAAPPQAQQQGKTLLSPFLPYVPCALVLKKIVDIKLTVLLWAMMGQVGGERALYKYWVDTLKLKLKTEYRGEEYNRVK